MRQFLITKEKIIFYLSKYIAKGATCDCYEGQIFKDNKKYAIKIYDLEYSDYFEREVKFIQKLNLLNEDLLNNKNENENNSRTNTNKNNITNGNINKHFIKVYSIGQGFICPYYSNENINKRFLEREISVTEKLDFDNYFPEKRPILYQIDELASNGELFNYIKIGTTQGFPEKIASNIFYQILLPIKILHENNIAHCDIKPENVLLDENFVPKLIDFGFSQEFSSSNCLLNSIEGKSVNYCPYEIKYAYTRGFNGVKFDIFSLGVLVFVLTVGEYPFDKAEFKDQRFYCLKRENYEGFWNFFSQYNLSEEFKDLVNNLICFQPIKRFSISQIQEHPWIKKNVDENLLLENENVEGGGLEKNNFENENFNCGNYGHNKNEIVEEFKYRKLLLDKKEI